jgi:hypothetical protein
VSSWTTRDSGKDHLVSLFDGSRGKWNLQWSVGNGMCQPLGLRFNCSGTELVVAEHGRGRVSFLSAEKWKPHWEVRRVVTWLRGPVDVEECEGGWLVSCAAASGAPGVACSLQFIGRLDDGTPPWQVDATGGGGGSTAASTSSTVGVEVSGPFGSALAQLPGRGLLVRDGGCLRLLQVGSEAGSLVAAHSERVAAKAERDAELAAEREALSAIDEKLPAIDEKFTIMAGAAHVSVSSPAI